MSARSRKPSVHNGRTAQDFTTLVEAVRRVHDECAARVSRTVNTTLTLRNWIIGSYIRDYEQHGADRAQYGARLLETLSDSLQACLDRCYTGRYLGLCRQLFDAYPTILYRADGVTMIIPTWILF